MLFIFVAVAAILVLSPISQSSITNGVGGIVPDLTRGIGKTTSTVVGGVVDAVFGSQDDFSKDMDKAIKDAVASDKVALKEAKKAIEDVVNGAGEFIGVDTENSPEFTTTILDSLGNRVNIVVDKKRYLTVLKSNGQALETKVKVSKEFMDLLNVAIGMVNIPGYVDYFQEVMHLMALENPTFKTAIEESTSAIMDVINGSGKIVKGYFVSDGLDVLITTSTGKQVFVYFSNSQEVIAMSDNEVLVTTIGVPYKFYRKMINADWESWENM